MAAERKLHVLIAVSEPCIGSLVHDVIEDEIGCCVTLTSRADDAFAVARASLYPLVVVVDQTELAMSSDGFIRLFTECADQLPPLAWVALMGMDPHPLQEVRVFLASTDASIVPTPFNVEEMLAVGRARGGAPGDGRRPSSRA
jgi:hypothetical protein